MDINSTTTISNNITVKQQKILHAAILTFLKYGFGNVSMDKISQEAHVSKATVYAYYSSKEELFLASLNYYRFEQNVIFPTLPETNYNLENVFPEVIFKYITECFNYFTNPAVYNLMRLLIAELNQFPMLFELHYSDKSTHLTSNLSEYLTKYFIQTNPNKVNSSFIIASNIIDLISGKSLWVKLMPGARREIFLNDPIQTIREIHNAAMQLILN